MDSNFWLNENLNFGTDIIEDLYVYVQNITNLNLLCHPGHHKALKTPVHRIGWKTNSELKRKYHENLMPFQNPKAFVWQQKQKIVLL